jgi:2-polyprenyl-3-methyl-5-hydroxy-6-metoxy-1,4-benzoquinol methylase
MNRTSHTTPLSHTLPLEKAVEDADVHASSDEYAARFGDAVGKWMLAVQERKLLRLLDDEITSVLDVGGGHGQVALPLCRAQRAVTVIGSSPECTAQLSQEIDRGIISFKCGNLIDLPFDAGSFNLVTSFRLMSHSVAWRTLVAEMCRVSNHAVIIDYPVWLSVNFISPLLFSLKRRVEGNTRTFKLFSNREIIREFKKHGFRLERLERQFVWPMALHRMLRSPQISLTLESIARALLVRRFFGSPVIAKFVRK